jgi:predicted nucleic acid-binding protein
MGQISVPVSGPVYLDTNAVIYFVERIEPFRTASLPLWSALNAGQLLAVTSELTLLEVLVKPFRDGNSALATLYRNVLLSGGGIRCAPVRRKVLEAAARIRADHGLKTPDAIHAATAQDAGCVLFVTNDGGFRRVPGLSVRGAFRSCRGALSNRSKCLCTWTRRLVSRPSAPATAVRRRW